MRQLWSGSWRLDVRTVQDSRSWSWIWEEFQFHTYSPASSFCQPDFWRAFYIGRRLDVRTDRIWTLQQGRWDPPDCRSKWSARELSCAAQSGWVADWWSPLITIDHHHSWSFWSIQIYKADTWWKGNSCEPQWFKDQGPRLNERGKYVNVRRRNDRLHVRSIISRIMLAKILSNVGEVAMGIGGLVDIDSFRR